jgi:hypothetical protein
MLSGDPPFTGDSPLAVAMQHVNQPPAPLSGSHPHLPSRLVQTVERMMAKKPADRFADPAALLGELNAVVTDGVQQGWAANSGGGNVAPRHGAVSGDPRTAWAEILQAADERAVVTSRLDELMKTAAMVRPSRLPARWVAAAILGCMLLGATLAFLLRPGSLLAGAHAGPAARDNVWRQLYHAKVVDTPDAWTAVIKNFPEAGEYQYHHNLARQGLVYHYLTRSQDPYDALAPLEELVASAQAEFQAFGIAGLVVAYTQLGDDEQATRANERLSAEMRATLEQQAPQMWQLLNDSLDELANRAL